MQGLRLLIKHINKIRNSNMKHSFFLSSALLLAVSFHVQAACNNPAPRALPFVVPPGQSCPSNYSQSGTTCNPNSGAGYAFVVSSGQSCPSNYGQSGRVCVANSGACYAFYVGTGSCPSGYGQSGGVCVSN